MTVLHPSARPEKTAPAESTTVVPLVPEDQGSREGRRRVVTMRRSDLLAVGGAALGALATTALLFLQLAPLSGTLGFVLVTYALFLVLYAVLVSFDETTTAVRDRVAAAVVHSLAAVLMAALVLVVAYTLARGLGALRNLNFFTSDLQAAGPLEPLTVGGVLHGVVGTLQQITIALLITIPVGISCAVFLNEVPGRFSRFVRTIVEAMTALPSVVVGLFIYATLILSLGFGKSGFAAAVAISVEMLPIIIRAADVVLRLVAGSLKEASYALGAGHWRTVWHVTLPTARSGLTTAVILGTARGIGETTPVLLTAGFTAALNANPFSGPQVSLPLLAFSLVKSPQRTMIERGFGAAAVLMLLVLLLFVIARVIGGRAPGDVTARGGRKRVAQSARDVERFTTRSNPPS